MVVCRRSFSVEVEGGVSGGTEKLPSMKNATQRRVFCVGSSSGGEPVNTRNTTLHCVSSVGVKGEPSNMKNTPI